MTAGIVPEQNVPLFITAVFCITGTFMWSNLLKNSKRFFVCLMDNSFQQKQRKQWYLIILVFIHSIGTLACSFPNCLCAIFSEACPTPYFHCAACGGYTLGQSMAQAVLAARLVFFQLGTKNRWLPVVAVTLVSARLITGIIQCAVSDYIQIPVWGYWAPIQSPKVLSAVYSLDFVNNCLFSSLFLKELYDHYKAMEKHSNQSTLYRMRQIFQNAALGGVLAGIGTIILAALIISETAGGEMQIVVIFAEITWNSVIVTHMVNGNHDNDSHNSNNVQHSDLSPKKNHKDAEMSLLTSASVFGARLEVPEPIAKRKSPSELRTFKYDHGEQNSPLSSKDELVGVQRVEEEFRINLDSTNTSLGAEKSGESNNSGLSTEKSSEKSPKEEELPLNESSPQMSARNDVDPDAMEVL